MREDERLYGLPYWHRFHHLPGVLVCPRHGDPLHELRIPFRERQQHFIAPSSLMHHAAAPEVSASAQAMLDNLALFANEGLCIDSEGYSPAVFCGAVRDGLTEMGLASKSGTIRAHAFALEFVEHHACLADLEPFAAYIKPEALVRLAKAMSTAALMLPPTLSLMLIRWVFGSWGLYQERCHWNMTMGSEDSPASGSSDDCGPGHKSADAIRTKHRNLCIEFLNANPEATRTDFWHTHPKACHWLHRHDSSWLGQQLLLAHGVQPIQMNLFASSQD